MSHGSVIVLRKEQDRPVMVARLRDSGYTPRTYRSLRRHIHIPDCDCDSAGFLDWDDILECLSHDDEVVTAAATSHSVTVDSSSNGGNWGLLRIISRDPPWRSGSPVLPHTSLYESERTGEGVDVYVIDTGVKPSHDEFGGRVTNVFEAISSGGLDDDNGHGSAVASLACGATIGAAKDSLIFSIKALGSGGTGTNLDLVEGMDEALTHYNGRSALNRPAVVNISIQSTSVSVETAASDLINAGMVICGAAANDGNDLATVNVFPAEAADVIAVGGSNMGDSPFFFPPNASNWGTRIDIVAPGQRTYAATIPNNFRSWTGTSMSTGVVSGAVACMLQNYKRLASRTQVQAVRNYVKDEATVGRLTTPEHGIDLPDRLLFLDPTDNPPLISGLTRSMRPSDSRSASKQFVVGTLSPVSVVSASKQTQAQLSLPRAQGVFGPSVVTTN